MHRQQRNLDQKIGKLSYLLGAHVKLTINVGLCKQRFLKKLCLGESRCCAWFVCGKWVDAIFIGDIGMTEGLAMLTVTNKGDFCDDKQRTQAKDNTQSSFFP